MKTNREVTKEFYEFIYNDDYNQIQHYFPAWEDLPECAKEHWDNKILEIINTEIIKPHQ